MRTFVAAATGLPTILLTAALVVVVCFWLLTAAGVVGVGTFDTDVDLRPWRLAGVPVAVALSVLTVVAWSLSVGAAVVVDVFVPPGPVTGTLALVVPGGAVPVAWGTTRLIVRLLHRLFPDEPTPSVPGRARAGDGTGLRGAGGRDPRGAASRDAAPRPGNRAV